MLAVVGRLERKAFGYRHRNPLIILENKITVAALLELHGFAIAPDVFLSTVALGDITLVASILALRVKECCRYV